MKEYRPKWREKYKGVTIYEEEENPEEFEQLLRDVDKEHRDQTVLCI